jgi:hypothetical protein
MFTKKKTIEHLGFAEALEHSLGEKECKCLLFTTTTLCEFNQSLLSPYSFSPFVFKTKKGGKRDCGCFIVLFLWLFSY